MVHLNLLSLFATSAILTQFVNGDDSSSSEGCNPLKSSNCPAAKALGASFSEDFSSESDWFESQNDSGEITYGSDGVALTLKKRFDNPGLKSKFYLMYGKVEVILKAGPGTGIVSSFFLQSDDLDEIDLEWLGGDDTQFQSNYFSKGNVATYDRGAYHGVSQPQAEFHNYTLEWAMDKTVWYLDGQPVRTLLNTTSQGYPQSPMFIKMGIWAGGDPSNEPGTIEWAGGNVDYSQAPFSMYVKKLVVSDYSSGSEYSYGDQSGSWESIKVKDGSVYGRFDQAQAEFAALVDGDEISSSSSTASSSTSSASSSASSSSIVSSTSSSSSSSATSSEVSSTTSSASSSSISSSSVSSSISSSTSSEPSSTASSTLSSSSSSSASSEPSTTVSPTDSGSTTESITQSTSSTDSEDHTATSSQSASDTTSDAPTEEPTTTKESSSTLVTKTSSASEEQTSESSSSLETIPVNNYAAALGSSHSIVGLLTVLGLAFLY